MQNQNNGTHAKPGQHMINSWILLSDIDFSRWLETYSTTTQHEVKEQLQLNQDESGRFEVDTNLQCARPLNHKDRSAPVKHSAGDDGGTFFQADDVTA